MTLHSSPFSVILTILNSTEKIHKISLGLFLRYLPDLS
uniref:Uncharacterized protein n=1 Tax=Anguilla anguilla TaxID=7936 RepID=A0A0E9UED8_ANGAN